MATLLDLTVQGDVGTLSDSASAGSQLPKIKLMAPLELYRLLVSGAPTTARV